MTMNQTQDELLAAATPELLEALENLIGEITEARKHIEISFASEDDAIAAIAKARGSATREESTYAP